MIRRQFRVLYIDALRRLIDREVLSMHAQGDAATLIGQVISLLLFLSLLFSVPAIYFTGRMAMPGQEFLIAVWTLQHFLIATTMLIAGIFAVLSWNSVFPDKRDLTVLSALPIRTRTLFSARIAAIATALGLLLLALHGLAGVVWPFAFNRYVPAQVLPDFISQPRIAPVSPANIKAVLDVDLASLQRNPALQWGGLSIGVAIRGVPRVFSYGAAKPDSIYEIGSVTKTFTALALAQMERQGLVKLTQPVRDLLPLGTVEKPNGREITLLDLATHHSGLPRMPTGFHRKNNDDPFADFDRADLYEYLSQRGVRRPAGATFSYSNLGFGLLGEALAERDHSSYSEMIKRRITDPLGLKDTVVALSREQRERLIQGHNGFSEGPDGFRRIAHRYGDPLPPTTFAAIAGAGALHSTAADLLRFAEVNLNPVNAGFTLSGALAESHKVRADVVDSAPAAEFIPLGTGVALAWLRTPEGCYLHGGAMPGYSAAVVFYPRLQWAIAVLSNTGPGGLLSAALIAEHIRQRLEGLPALSLSPVSIPASGGFTGWLRLFASYWLTMIAAATFTYCSVLALQGFVAEMLPRQWFLRISSFLQIAVFCLLIGIYFLQPVIPVPNLFDVNSTGPPEWSPSYWFLGLLQKLNGSPALGFFAHRALLGLAVAVSATAGAYTLCYFRSLQRIIEQPDVLPSAYRQLILPLFRRSLQAAIIQFSIRTLLRSRQHRLILAFYLAIGFGATILLLKSPVAAEMTSSAAIDPWRQVSAPLLAASMIVMGFWVVGTRAVFSLPLELRANWIFRTLPLDPGSDYRSAMRYSVWVLSVIPAWLLFTCVFLSCWPWQAAIEHLFLLAILGLTIAEVCVQGNPKIPFTCGWLPGKANLHIAFWMCIVLILEIVLRLADWEASLLKNPRHWGVAALLLTAIAAAAALLASRFVAGEGEPLEFDEVPSWQLTRLSLSE